MLYCLVVGMKTFNLKIYHVLLLMMCYNSSYLVFAQKMERLQALMTQTEQFSSFYPQEKVYLHFDNTSYYIGERIFFKAYVTMAADHSLSALSKTLYVDLLNKNGKLVERKIYPVVDGRASGDFFLFEPSLIFAQPHNAGYYEVRAYTRWMRNWDENCVFSRVLPVFNKPWEPGEWPLTMYNTVEVGERIEYNHRKALDLDNLNLTFYPEGGSLVEGVTSTVAFKATDENGASVNLQIGKIRTRKGKQVVDDLFTVHNGMGLFTCTPEAGEEYVADVIYRNKRYVFDLPPVEKQGYVLSVNNYPPKRMVLSIAKSPGMADDTLGLTISCRGKVYASQITPLLGDAPVQLSISKEPLPRGVVQVTLFNSLGKILCERMVFCHNPSAGDRLRIEVDTTELNFAPHSLSRLSFRVTGQQGIPQPYTYFSVSVRDGKTDIPSAYNESAEINLLLSSDLKGYIENPRFYFEKEDATRLKSLDLLMLVQGWKRYAWDQLAGTVPFEVAYKAEKGISIDGKILHLMNKKKEYKDLHISYVMQGLKFDDQLTDENGDYSFTEHFYGKQRIFLQTSNKKYKRRETYITLNRNFSPVPRPLEWGETHYPLYFRNTTPVLGKDLNSSIDLGDATLLDPALVKGINIDSFAVTAKKKRVRMIETVQLDVDFLMEQVRDEGIEIHSLSAFLRRFDPYYGGYKGYYDMRCGCVNDGHFHNDKPCLIYYTDDNITPDFLESDKSNIRKWHAYGGYNVMLGYKKICIFDVPENRDQRKRASLVDIPYGFSVIAIQVHNKAVNRREAYGVRQSTIYGYNHIANFYSPQYLSVPDSSTVDLRRTLIWSPNLLTGQDGRSELEFYNNTSSEEFLINAECIAKQGKIGSLYREAQDKLIKTGR